jgi:predicted metal-dependent enzyme (double-stranded beta helix superfamily)
VKVMQSPSLTAFIDEVERIAQAGRDQQQIVGRLEPLVREFVAGDSGWLRDEYRRPPAGKTGVAAGYGQYCLYRRADRLSIVVFCWGAGEGTPIHDHLAWGVLGFIDGSERETRYRRLDDGGDPDVARLEQTVVVLTERGQTSHIMTPARDIHRVENPGDAPSVSLHIYGCDIGTQRRRMYDPKTGRVTWYVTPHDSDEVVR